jgi:hypothetical protein
MSIFHKTESQTEPLRGLERLQAELRTARALGDSQEAEIERLRRHDVFRSAVATPEEYGHVKNELELLQVQRAQTLARQRQIQAVIDSALSADRDREALAAATVEEAEAAEAVKQASTLCARLDDEFRSWQLRKDQSLRVFYDSLSRHKSAKDKLTAAPKPMNVRPVTTATGAVTQV